MIGTTPGATPADPVLACPRCRGGLEPAPGGLRCGRCDRAYLRRGGWIDFSAGAPSRVRGIGPALMEQPALARVYQRWWRPAFVRVAGGRGRPSFDDEVAWVLHALAPARGGPVLDLSCGPGAFARRLVETSLFSRVYALDASQAMLERCTPSDERDPAGELVLLEGDASLLPFADGALAGVHAGAALHLWERPGEGVCEVARALRPGGVFVASTFVRGESRAAGILADAFQWASRARVFDEASLRNTTASVGLSEWRAVRRGAFVVFSVIKA
jgi:SAM-dependent methyltransferase